MRSQLSTGQAPGSRSAWIGLAAAWAAVSVLLYLEHFAAIYVASAVAVSVFMLLAAFPNLKTAAALAAEEAYMTRKSEGVFDGLRSPGPRIVRKRPLDNRKVNSKRHLSALLKQEQESN